VAGPGHLSFALLEGVRNASEQSNKNLPDEVILADNDPVDLFLDLMNYFPRLFVGLQFHDLFQSISSFSSATPSLQKDCRQHKDESSRKKVKVEVLPDRISLITGQRAAADQDLVNGQLHLAPVFTPEEAGAGAFR
jgi:hypothetical protein